MSVKIGEKIKSLRKSKNISQEVLAQYLGVTFQAVIAAADTAVFHHALAGAGGVGDKCPLIPAMAQRIGVVGNEGAAAALA